MKSESQTNDSYELVLIPRQINIVSWYFLVIQKHRVQPMLSDSQTNDSYKSVIFSE